jgi:predicted nucleic acid-binding protein
VALPVAETWVTNASPLISLDRIGSLHLVGQLGREIVVPAAVLAEVGKGPKPLTKEQIAPHKSVDNVTVHPIVAAWDLGSGESQVLSWATTSPGAIAILDDRAARRCAAALGVATHGTLHVLLEAKRAGLIPVVAPLIERLRTSGLFLSDSLVRAVLKSAGEAT